MKVKSPSEADILIQKLPSDMGIHRNPRKGTLKAPKTLLKDFSFKNKVMIDEVFPDEFDLEATHKRIEHNTRDLLNYGKPLLSIGGDHSVSFPVIKALKQEFPDLQLIWLDSHLDLKEKVKGHVSHDVVVRELLENGFSEDEIWFVGITKIDGDEEEFLEDHDLRVFEQDELQKFLGEFDSSEQSTYLSVDIDVLKQGLAPGTGYPDGELSLEEVERVIETVDPNHADLVEVAPPFDKENRTVQNARIVFEKLGKTLV
ncbi:MAG: arginase family protein [Nanohaloarchaea archaeon]|nr:arginase family protein [Candidatus Nanohaloarchaea archaeon]